MIELLRTNDFVLLNYVGALLKGDNIPFDDFDAYMNINPRRIMVGDGDAARARRLLTDAGLAHVLSSPQT